MKVLFAANYPSPYRVDFFNELGKLCELDVVFEERPEAQTHRDGEWFHTNYDNFEPAFLRQSVSRNGHCIVSFEILKVLKRKKYDAVIFGVYSTWTQMLGIKYMQMRGQPYWISSDGGMAKSGRGLREKIKKALIGRACGYFSPSDITDRYLEFYGADAKKIFRYPFTSLMRRDILNAPVSFEEKRERKRRLGMVPGRAAVTVGQFIPRKGFDLLLRAVPLAAEDIHYYFIGGNATEEYLSLSRQLGIADRVHFVGFRKQEALADYYRAADFFVLPTREDIWGLVVNEAMANGLPVVTTDRCVAGLELVRNGETGLIAESGNIADLARAIDDVAGWNGSASRRCLDVISQYTLEKMAEVHFSILSMRLDGK